MKVFAISGWKRSGKDTVADYLTKYYNFERISFANPLKDEVTAKFGIPRDDLDNPEFKEQAILSMPVNPEDEFSKMIARFMAKEFRAKDGRTPNAFDTNNNRGVFGPDSMVSLNEVVYWTPRALAILVGSTSRAVESSHWVRKAIASVANRQKTTNEVSFVISDLRYKSELNQLKDAFGDDLVSIRINRFDSSPSNDPSERDLDDYTFDVTMSNKGTKEELYSKVNDLIDYANVVKFLK